MQFSDLNLDARVLKAVQEAGYETPTPIQAEAIPHALEGRDVLGIAQTGTGKTASFTLPMLSLLAKGRARARMPRSLVLCPTRELAAQVADNFEIYSKHMKLTMALLIGGVSFADQDKKIDRGVDVLIATPGRLLDHFERGKLMLTGIEVMVVDEADRMLDMGFIPDIERIFKLTPFTRQTLFFSATMPPEITKLTQEFLSNPVRVEVARASSAAETVEQAMVVVKPSRKDKAAATKRDALRALIRKEGDGVTNAIVFCNRKRDVGIVYRSMQKHGFNVGALHGDLDQRVRMQVLDGFRNGDVQFLVASDVAARGLDIPAVSHVFNFDAPVHSEDYIHRIGRTGRAGRSGKAFTLMLPEDEKAIKKIEELVGREINRVEVAAGPAETERAPERTERTEAKPDRKAPRRKDVDEKDSGRKKQDRKPRDAEPKKSARRSKPDVENGRGRRGGYREREYEPVVGMGDHVPAFLLRPVVFPGKRRNNPGDDDGPQADAA